MVAGRVLVLRERSEDKRTWKWWSGWLVGLYFLPVVRDWSVFGRFAEEFRGIL